MDSADDGELSRAQFYGRIKVVWQLLAESFFFWYVRFRPDRDRPAENTSVRARARRPPLVNTRRSVLAGLLTSLSVFTSLVNVNHLRRLYENYAASRQHDKTSHLFPSIQAPEGVRKLAQLSPIGLPLLFIAAWAVVLVGLIRNI
jgi:hypothetical protein